MSFALSLSTFHLLELGLKLHILTGNLLRMRLSYKGCWRRTGKKEHMVGRTVELSLSLETVVELLYSRKHKDCWSRNCSPGEQ